MKINIVLFVFENSTHFEDNFLKMLCYLYLLSNLYCLLVSEMYAVINQDISKPEI